MRPRLPICLSFISFPPPPPRIALVSGRIHLGFITRYDNLSLLYYRRIGYEQRQNDS